MPISVRELNGVGSTAARMIRQRGVRGTVRRAAQVTLHRWSQSESRLPLLPEDIAHSSTLELATPATHVSHERPLKVGWVCPPGGPGSGGHTTMFRMVQALEDAGHECHLFLYDRFGGELRRHARAVRAGWPTSRPVVHDALAGIGGVDMALATSWESAHVLASRSQEPMRRGYFIQDYEPFFHPRGWEYALAEDSYRFGFRCIALGRMVSEVLQTELGVSSDTIDFGVDTAQYHLTNPRRREGVAFFARPGIDRRGYELGTLALREFHRRHPDQPIHVFPSEVPDIEFPVVRHRHLSPSELNGLYNTVAAGVALSYTNVSLVPEEMLTAGVVPVCNDSVLARSCLANPHVRWAVDTPSAIADQLSLVVRGLAGAEPRELAASVDGRGWSRAQRELVHIVENEAYGRAGRRAEARDRRPALMQRQEIS